MVRMEEEWSMGGGNPNWADENLYGPLRCPKCGQLEFREDPASCYFCDACEFSDDGRGNDEPPIEEDA